MTEIAGILAPIWAAVLLHLWQSTLIIVPLILLGRWLGRATPRQQEIYWSLLAFKLLVPVAAVTPLAQWLWHRLPAGTRDELASGTLPVLQLVDMTRLGGTGLETAGIATTTAGATILVLATMAWHLGCLRIIWRTLLDLDAQFALRRAARPATSLAGPGRAALLGAARRTGVPFNRLLVHDALIMPAAVGLLRPCIIVPRRLIEQLALDEIAAILQHEESHRRRRDPLRSVSLRLVLALFFFYPPLHVVLRKLRETAEFTGDERVLTAGIAPHNLARALALATRLYIDPRPLASAAGSGGASLMRRRLQRLAHPERKHMFRSRLLIVLAMLLVCAVFIAPQELSQATTAATATESVGGAEPESDAEPVVEPDPDTHPEVIVQARPEYPEEARKAKAAGSVTVKMLIDEGGDILDVEILKGVPDYPCLDQAALEAATKCEFKPATKNGEAVATWVALTYLFQLD